MVTKPQRKTAKFEKYPASAVVFDVEFTAWDASMTARWMKPGEYKEIIQLAAVKVDAAFRPLETFDVLVRPRVNPKLSAYVERVTGIANADLDVAGLDFPEAYRRFSAFVGDLPLVAYGRDDLVLKQNLRLCGLPPRIPPFTNIIAWMGEQGIDVRKGHGCDVGPAVGVAFVGRPHNALDDAASLAAGIAAVLARGAPSPLPSTSSPSVADRIADQLGLSPHPEGGAYVETFRDVAGPDGRAYSTEIYFLLRADEVSRKHRIDATEVWHFYRGAPLELTVEPPGQPARQIVLGPDIAAGERPQVVIPPHVWQSARSLGDYTLVGCTVAPAFDFAKFELAD